MQNLLVFFIVYIIYKEHSIGNFNKNAKSILCNFDKIKINFLNNAYDKEHSIGNLNKNIKIFYVTLTKSKPFFKYLRNL